MLDRFGAATRLAEAAAWLDGNAMIGVTDRRCEKNTA
jgi:hypothetical protein